MKITQYKPWPLNIIDTIIPFLYSIVIYLLVYFIKNIGVFTLMFSFLCGLWCLEYWNTLIRMQKNRGKISLRDTFSYIFPRYLQLHISYSLFVHSGFFSVLQANIYLIFYSICILYRLIVIRKAA